MKSSVKTDRNWGPEDPMLQYQWHQLNTKTSEDVEIRTNERECKESKNVKVIMQRVFSASTPNTNNRGDKGKRGN